MDVATITVFLNVLCLVLLIGFTIYTVVIPFFTVPFVASSTKSMLKMFELAEIGPNDDVVDLGSGDGRFVLAASRLSKSATGIEHNPYLTLYSRFMAVISTNGVVKFKQKSYFKEDLSKYDVVFCYLFPGHMEKLREKFEKELKPGSRIVTNTFTIKGWKPAKSMNKRNPSSLKSSNDLPCFCQTNGLSAAASRKITLSAWFCSINSLAVLSLCCL